MDWRGLVWKGGDQESGPPERSSPPPRTTGFTPSAAPPAKPRRTFLTSAAPSTRVSSVAAPPPKSGPLPASRSSAAPDPEFLDDFEGALGEAKTPGYAEFLSQRTALSAFIRDEDQLVAAALQSAAKAHGSTPSQVLTSARECQKIVENLKHDLYTQLEQEAREGVQDKTTRVNTIASEIAAHERQITEMQTEIELLRGEKSTLESQISRVDAEKAAVKSRVESAYEAVSSQLSTVIESIGRHA